MMARTIRGGNDGKNYPRWHWWQKLTWVDEITRRETLWAAVLGSLQALANQKNSILFVALHAARNT